MLYAIIVRIESLGTSKKDFILVIYTFKTKCWCLPKMFRHPAEFIAGTGGHLES